MKDNEYIKKTFNEDYAVPKSCEYCSSRKDCEYKELNNGIRYACPYFPIDHKLQITRFLTCCDEAEIKKLQFKLGLGAERLSPDGLYYMDEDYVAFIVDADGKLLSDSHFVFYNSDLRLRVVDPGWNPDLIQPLTIVHSDEWDKGIG